MCYQVLFSGFLVVLNELNVLFFSLAAWFLGGTDSLTCNLECCSHTSSGYLHVIVIFENTHPEVLFSGFLAVLYEFNVLFPYFVAYRGTVSLTCCPECCSDASSVYFHILVIPGNTHSCGYIFSTLRVGVSFPLLCGFSGQRPSRMLL